MVTKSRKSTKGSKVIPMAAGGVDSIGIRGDVSPVQGVSATVIREGITDLGGTIRLSLGAVEDMLAGTITAGEASVVNTAVGRVLKAVELQLKYANRNDKSGLIKLPGKDE